jgi:hypothetical protein
MKSPDALHYVLFPHTVMSEIEYRCLSLLAPQVSMLQILDAPNIPAWGRERFPACAGVEDEGLRERVRLYLKGYQDFADMHRGSGALAALRHEIGATDGEKSRFLLQSELKGKPPQARNPTDWLLAEAAVFLELARDLDVREIDLETGFHRLEELEEDFRRVIGSTEDEEFEAVIGASGTRLVPERNRLSLLLSKRIVSWYRLVAACRSIPPAATISLCEDVVEELIDPVQSKWESAGRGFNPVRIPLATLRGMQELQPREFVELLAELTGEGILLRYWDGLAEVVNDPHAQPRREQLADKAQVLSEHVDAFLLKNKVHSARQTVLVLTYLDGISHDDYWQGLDNAGYRQFQTGRPDLSLQPVLLHLEWK